jgi:PAS domain S-box-containing protein
MQGKRLKIDADNKEVKAAWDAVERGLDRLFSRLAAIQRTHIVYETDPNGAFVYVNAAFSAAYGYTLDEVAGQTPRILKSEKHPAALYDEMWRTLTAGKAWSGLLVNRGKDGVLKKTYTSVLPKTGGYVAVGVDLTPFAQDPVLGESNTFVGADGRLVAESPDASLRQDHKKLVEALEAVRVLADEHRRNYENAQETIALMTEAGRDARDKIRALDAAALVSVTDPDGFIVEINDYFSAFTRYDESALVGKRHNVLRSPQTPDDVFDEMWQTIASGRDWRGVLQNLSADGEELWLQTTIHPVLNEHGAIEKYVSVQIDVTETLELLLAARDEVEKQRSEIFDYRNKVAKLTHEVRSLTHKLKQLSDDKAYGPPSQSPDAQAAEPQSDFLSAEDPAFDSDKPQPRVVPDESKDKTNVGPKIYVLGETMIDHFEYCLAVGNYEALEEWAETVQDPELAREVMNALDALEYPKLSELFTRLKPTS